MLRPAALLLLPSLALACADRPPPRAEALPPPSETSSTTATPEPASTGSPACARGGGAPGVHKAQVPVFGKNRTYTLVVPPGYAPTTSFPLVFVLHGHGGSGAQVRGAFDLEGASQGKALFVYPDGLRGGWDLDAPASKNADVALFDAVLAVTQSSYCVDLRRVFVAGFSNGGYMANQLACRRGDRIRAVASHSAGGPYETAGEYDAHGNLVCKGKPVASLVVHGTADGSVVPAEGQKSVDHWTHANRCTGSAPASPAGCVAFQGCSNPVVACKVPGLGHAVWPEARQLVWSFFSSLPSP